MIDENIGYVELKLGLVKIFDCFSELWNACGAAVAVVVLI